MSSRGAYSADRRGKDVLAGTYQADGGYVTVSVRQGRFARSIVVEERQRIPGVVCQGRVRSLHGDEHAALRMAEAVVLCRGGALGADAEVLGESPVRPTLARAMFTEIGMRRFVHVPTGRPAS